MSPSFWILVIDFLSAAFLGMMVTELILSVSYQRKLFDLPDERKVHNLPVPRLGGVSFLPVMMITIAVTVGMMYHQGLTGLFQHDYYVLIQLSVLLGSGMLMYIVGVADDLSPIDFRMKFLFQFVASCIVVMAGLWIKDYFGLLGIHRVPGIIGMPFSVLLIIYIINSINLIDGIDGLASGIGIISLIALTAIAFVEKRFLHMMIGVTALGVVTVFWLYNMFGKRERSTKVFMGDSGSLTLGLVLSFLIINISDITSADPSRNAYYMAIGFSTLIIPMLDVPRIVGWRLIHRRSPFKPDSNHIHHLLMRCGLSQHGALGVLIGLDVFLIVLNVILGRVLPVTWLFFLDILLWILFTVGVLWKLRLRVKTFPSESVPETQDR